MKAERQEDEPGVVGGRPRGPPGPGGATSPVYLVTSLLPHRGTEDVCRHRSTP